VERVRAIRGSFLGPNTTEVNFTVSKEYRAIFKKIIAEPTKSSAIILVGLELRPN
jgi:hypothetical protein